MRSEQEIKDKIRATTVPEQITLLKWAMETCEACDGQGTLIQGCKQCGRREMCWCNGDEHPRGIGCM